MDRRTAAPLLSLILAACPTLAEARQDREPEPVDRLPMIVGVREVPPFVIRGEDGAWSGITIELWDRIDEELGLDGELRVMMLDEMLEGLESGAVDVGLGALTITADRERRLDFSHPFVDSGLGIAAAGRGRSGPLRAVAGLLSAEAIAAFGLVLLALLVVGSLVWLVERRRNEQFAGRAAEGVGAGLWWAAVTMTTVGYGDKAPATPVGRALAVVWMFASLFLVAALTASVTTALTVARLDAPVRGLADLYDVRVGTVDASTAAEYLGSVDLDAEAFDDAEAGLRALADGRLDAFVYDRPVLRYLLAEDRSLGARVVLLPDVFERQRYALGLPDRSPHRESINRVLLEVIEGERWAEIIERYLG